MSNKNFQRRRGEHTSFTQELPPTQSLPQCSYLLTKMLPNLKEIDSSNIGSELFEMVVVLQEYRFNRHRSLSPTFILTTRGFVLPGTVLYDEQYSKDFVFYNLYLFRDFQCLERLSIRNVLGDYEYMVTESHCHWKFSSKWFHAIQLYVGLGAIFRKRMLPCCNSNDWTLPLLVINYVGLGRLASK